MASTVELPSVPTPNGDNRIADDDDDDNYIPESELEDFQPLVTGGEPSSPVRKDYEDQDLKVNPIEYLFRIVQQRVVMIGIALVIVIALMVLKTNSSLSSSHSSNLIAMDVTKTIEVMKINYEEAKQQLLAKLKFDYGEDNLNKMLLEDDRSYNFYKSAPNGTSDYRFHRKLTIKILRAIVQEVSKSGDKKKGGKEGESDSTTDTIDESSLVQYIWATGGHSAAAGHGNLFDEAYTVRMEIALKPVLRSIGINFIGRNYAMGATSSGPQVGLCSKEIFGLDIDALSWDFGMTDGGNYHFGMLYFYRTVMAVKGVACMAFNTGGVGSFNEYMKITKFLDNSGAIALISPDANLRDAIKAIPDSFGLTDDQINAMPEYVRNFRCQRGYEGGEPYCDKFKYNDTICAARRYKASWHPGWKWHALIGNMKALFMMKAFETALHDITNVTTVQDVKEILEKLQNEEDADYLQIINGDGPTDYFKRYFAQSNNTNEDQIAEIATMFAKGPNICHTAVLPAEIRHKGILTETNQTGVTAYNKEITYYQGIGMKEASKGINDGESIRLVYDDSDLYECPVHLYLDRKDFFYIHEKESTKKLILPNDLEIQEYFTNGGQDYKKLKGIMVVCLRFWAIGREMRWKHFEENKVEMHINNQKVSSKTIFMTEDCSMLINEQTGGLNFKPNDEGKFEISLKVNEPNSFFRVSEFVLF